MFSVESVELQPDITKAQIKVTCEIPKSHLRGDIALLTAFKTFLDKNVKQEINRSCLSLNEALLC